MAHAPKPSICAYQHSWVVKEPGATLACMSVPGGARGGASRGTKQSLYLLPEQTPMVVGTLVRDKKGLRTCQENLKSYTLLLPSDLTSKLQISITAGGLSRISLQFQSWKTKMVPLRGVGEPNNFLSSVSLALNFQSCLSSVLT